jgi:hypothetical protein
MRRWFARDKSRDRYYLLPGMGGRNLRRKQLMMLIWGIAAGLLASGLVVCLIYFISYRSMGR